MLEIGRKVDLSVYEKACIVRHVTSEYSSIDIHPKIKDIHTIEVFSA